MASSSTERSASTETSLSTCANLPKESVVTLDLNDALACQSIIDIHNERNRQGVTFLDIVKGSGPEVQTSSKVELKYVGTLPDNTVWGRPKNSVGGYIMLKYIYDVFL